MFAIAAETGWPEDRVLFMPLARLTQYQHCLLRRNGVRVAWAGGPHDRSAPALFSDLKALWALAQERS